MTEEETARMRWLEEEVAYAHHILTEIGVGNRHWSLPGRIDEFLTLAWGWAPADWQEKIRKRGLGALIDEFKGRDGGNSTDAE